MVSPTLSKYILRPVKVHSSDFLQPISISFRAFSYSFLLCRKRSPLFSPWPLCLLIPSTSVPRTDSLHHWEAPSHCLPENMPLQGILLLYLHPLPCYLLLPLPSVYFISEKKKTLIKEKIFKKNLNCYPISSFSLSRPLRTWLPPPLSCGKGAL